MLLIPLKKVAQNPFPSIGNTLSNEKFSRLAKNIATMLIRIIGIANKFALTIAVAPSLLHITAPIIKSITKSITGVLGKYMIFKFSQNSLISRLEENRKYNINNIPIAYLKTFPPTNSEISKISNRGNFENNLQIK